MGYSVTWIASSGGSAEALISASQRQRTGERIRNPSDGYYLLELAGTPWVILIAYGTEYLENLDSELARSLSDGGGETLRFCCCDSVMATQLECFKSGSMVWSVDYDCEDEEAPVITGDAPPMTRDLLKDLVTQQEAEPTVDFVYELTAELGSELIGFRHDQSPPEGRTAAFQVLQFESASQNDELAAPRGPLDQLSRSLVFSGTVHGIPVKKSESHLMIGTMEFGVEAVEGRRDQIQLTFRRDGKESKYRGNVARCATRIHSFCSPGARSQRKA